MKDPPLSLDLSTLSEDAQEKLKAVDPSIRHLFVIDTDHLIKNPQLASHYRCLLGLSKKAAPKGFPLLASIEKNSRLPRAVGRDELRAEVARANEAIVETFASVNFDSDVMTAVIASTVGATLDGEWRNEIGDLAEYDVAEAICHFVDTGLAQIVGGSTVHEVSDCAQAIEVIRAMRNSLMRVDEIRLQNGAYVLFPANPDMQIYAPSGKLVAVGELKGNTDPANMWERWPLAEKTLGEAKMNNPGMQTIFIGEVITENVAFGQFAASRQHLAEDGSDAMRRGIKQRIEDGTVDHAFKKVFLKYDPHFRKLLQDLLEIEAAPTQIAPTDLAEPLRDADLGGAD